MRELVYLGGGRLEWQERAPLTVQGDLEAIVRPVAATTCDLDRRIVADQTPFVPPFAIGHECVAEIEAVGDKVTRLARGDLVVVPWHVCCGACASCRRGLTAHCDAVPGPINAYGTSLGPRYGGMFSESLRVPFAEGMLVRLPAGVEPAAVASASDNLTDAYIAVARGLARHPGAAVLVLGGLPSLGLYAVEHAIAGGAAAVDYVDAGEERRALAARAGARVHVALPADAVRRFDVVVNADREPESLAAAIRACAPGGHLSNVAMFFGDTPVPLWDFYTRDLSFAAGLASVGPHIPAVLERARCGHIHPERIGTRHAWDDAPRVLLEPRMKPVMVRPAVFGAPVAPLAAPA